MAGEKQSKKGQQLEGDPLKVTEQSEGIPGVNEPCEGQDTGKPGNEEHPPK